MGRTLKDRFGTSKDTPAAGGALRIPTQPLEIVTRVPDKNALSEKDWHAIHRLWRSPLFNEFYLKHEIRTKKAREMEEYNEGFQKFLTQFRQLCENRQSESFKSWKESDTIESWIMPVMQALGWWDTANDPCVREASLTTSDNRTFFLDRLFVQKSSLKKHIQENKGAKQLEYARKYGILALEAKYWDRFEKYRKGEIGNKEDKSRSDIGGKDSPSALSPSGQILAYLKLLKSEDPPRNYFGIVTDGRTWRLHHVSYSEDRFYEFDLGGLLYYLKARGGDIASAFQGDPKLYDWYVEAARYFYYFFSKDVLFKDNEPTFVDGVLKYSQRYVAQAEEDLRARFMDAMKFTCNGLQRACRNEKLDFSLEQIRGLAESHLFNLLFIKSCEAKGVLPLYTNYKERSLTYVVERLRQFDPALRDEDNEDPILRRAFGDQYRNKHFDLFDASLRLTQMIEEGIDKESDYKIAGFKESVFSKEEKSVRAKLKLTNIEMIKVLFALGYLNEGGDWKQIPYNIFTTRQLGSIYESLLEYKVDVDHSNDLEFTNKAWKPLSRATRERLNRNEQVKNPIALKGELFFTPDNSDRKASGSYYTPDYVVQYITRKCLEPVLENKSSREILELRICDPAMGSGHFLNAAMSFIADRYLEAAHTESGAEFLTAEDAKRRILDACIFGVDRNYRAVKLARMSLWLETAHPSKKLENLEDQLLPGDSIFAYKNKTFSWQNLLSSKKIEKFDALLGNPPYFNIDEQFGYSSEEGKFLKNAFPEIYIDKTDILFYFVGLALKQAKTFGFILKRTFLEADKASNLRGQLAKDCNIHTIVDFNDYEVFWPEASINTAILIAATGARSSKTKVIRALKAPKDNGEYGARVLKCAEKDIKAGDLEKFEKPQGEFGRSPWTFENQGGKELRSILEKDTIQISELFVSAQGMQTGANEVFGGFKVADIKRLGARASNFRKLIKNSDILPFFVDFKDELSLWVEDAESFSKLPEGIRSHLTRHRSLLSERSTVKNEGHCWFKFTRALAKEWYDRKLDRLIVPYRARYSRFALVPKGEHITYTDTTVMFPKFNDREKLITIMAILNSPICEYLYQWNGKPTGSGMREYFKVNMDRISIREPNAKLCSVIAKKLAKYIDDETDVPSSVVQEVNSEIFQFYGLTDSTICVLEAYSQSLRTASNEKKKTGS
jgi:type I restriction-modification system DNA methylase subunit